MGFQAYDNYSYSCGVFDIDNYNWRFVGVSAAVSAFAPGWGSVGKTVFSSSKAVGALSRQAANTSNRAAKIANRISKHKSKAEKAVVTQVGFQAAKKIGTQSKSNNQCDCN